MDLSVVPVPRLLALGYALMELSDAASWREGMRMASAAFDNSVAEIQRGSSLHASDQAYDLSEGQVQYGGIGQAHADGSIMMVLEYSMTLGDDTFTLETLARYASSSSSSSSRGGSGSGEAGLGLRLGMADCPAPSSGLRLPLNSEPIFWNAALVWFRAKGGDSKRARKALAVVSE